jgi:hypothetical protein
VYRLLVVDDERLERGLADGSLVVDTRLRDALRVSRAPVEPAARPADRTLFAQDDAALQDADIVRLVRRLDDLRIRLDAVERRARA